MSRLRAKIAATSKYSHQSAETTTIQRRRREHSRIQLEAGAEADGDDRLAERDQNDQPVPLGEMLGRDLPAAPDADQDRAEVVDRKRDPDRNAFATVEEAAELGEDRRRRSEPRRRYGGRDRRERRWLRGRDGAADEQVRDTEQQASSPKAPGTPGPPNIAPIEASTTNGRPLVDIWRARRHAWRSAPERQTASRKTPPHVGSSARIVTWVIANTSQVEEELERRDRVLVARRRPVMGLHGVHPRWHDKRVARCRTGRAWRMRERRWWTSSGRTDRSEQRDVSERNDRLRCGAYGIDSPIPHLRMRGRGCSAIIRLTLVRYEEVQTDSRHFLNSPGHQDAAEVVAERNGYVIGEKLGRAGDIVDALDERSPEDRGQIFKA
jgi:hypothetical protein